jgi:hypothetical protein
MLQLCDKILQPMNANFSISIGLVSYFLYPRLCEYSADRYCLLYQNKIKQHRIYWYILSIEYL